MATKAKKMFDCVEMKNRIQAELLAEYEANKDKSPSFVHFLKSRNDRNKWVQAVRAKFGLPK